MDNTNDLLLLKNCLLSLSKISLGKHDDNEDSYVNIMLRKLIKKLEKSDNGYIHGAIGNYYLFNKRVIRVINIIFFPLSLRPIIVISISKIDDILIGNFFSCFGLELYTSEYLSQESI